MKIFTHSVIAFFLLLSMSLTLQAQEQDEDLKAHFSELNQKMSKAIVDGDIETILSFYHDDVIDMPAYRTMMRGKKEVATEMKKGMEMDEGKMTKFSLEVKEVIRDGNLAVEVGTYSLLYEMPGMPEAWPDKGNYVSVWEKQDDGNWLTLATTWNSHNNPWLDMMENQGGDVEEKSKGSSEVHSHDHNCNHDCTEEEQKNCEHHKEDTK